MPSSRYDTRGPVRARGCEGSDMAMAGWRLGRSFRPRRIAVGPWAVGFGRGRPGRYRSLRARGCYSWKCEAGASLWDAGALSRRLRLRAACKHPFWARDA